MVTNHRQILHTKIQRKKEDTKWDFDSDEEEWYCQKRNVEITKLMGSDFVLGRHPRDNLLFSVNNAARLSKFGKQTNGNGFPELILNHYVAFENSIVSHDENCSDFAPNLHRDRKPGVFPSSGDRFECPGRSEVIAW